MLPDAAGVLVTGGLGLVLEPMATAIESRRRWAPSADVLVLVDLNCRPAAIDDRDGVRRPAAAACSRRADVVKASDEDLAWLRPGVPAPPRPRGCSPTDAGRARDDRRHGARRSSRRAGSVTVPVDAVPVVDTIGAGDAFTAGFVSWWLASGRRRSDLGDLAAVERAVHAAHAVAAVVVGRRGADPPRRAELSATWL